MKDRKEIKRQLQLDIYSFKNHLTHLTLRNYKKCMKCVKKLEKIVDKSY